MKYQLVRIKGENKEIVVTGSKDYCEGYLAALSKDYCERYLAALELVETWRNLFFVLPHPDRPGRDESHAPGCAMNTISSAECTCGKADRESEDEEEDKDRRRGLYGPEYPGENF